MVPWLTLLYAECSSLPHPVEKPCAQAHLVMNWNLVGQPRSGGCRETDCPELMAHVARQFPETPTRSTTGELLEVFHALADKACRLLSLQPRSASLSILIVAKHLGIEHET